MFAASRGEQFSLTIRSVRPSVGERASVRQTPASDNAQFYSPPATSALRATRKREKEKQQSSNKNAEQQQKSRAAGKREQQGKIGRAAAERKAEELEE